LLNINNDFTKKKIMNRKAFFEKVGFGAVAVFIPACIAGVATSCSSDSNGGNSVAVPPANIDFSLDTSTGSLAANGGYLVTNGIVVARTLAGGFLAVSASCPHEGTNVKYNSSGNDFYCPNHNAHFTNTGVVTQGPATSNLKEYKTTLTGTTLRVFS
jgi:cytochrome b6-f complex iron-sulfur subunit